MTDATPGKPEASPSQPDSSSPGNDKNSAPKKRMSPRARFILRTLGLLVLVIVAAWVLYYQFRGKYLESTNDAFVQADSVTVSSKVTGYVDQVLVADNQIVKAGQALVRIDARDYSAQAAQAKAQIDAAAASEEAAKAQLAEQQAAIAQAKAQLASADEDARFASAEVERYTPLAASGAETRERLTSLRNQQAQARSTVAARRAALDAAQLRVRSLQAQVRQAQAQGETARAQYDAASVNLGYTEIRASVDGRIGDKQVRVGQFVSPGTRMMTVVPTHFYVSANFKETQIGIMRIGQPAIIKVDALPGVEFHGHVDSLSPGTGAQFSLLPPQNATGNFTKIVQRVPVRIAIDATPEETRAFVAGLSVTVEVNTIAAKDELRDLRERNSEINATRKEPQ
ncbi:MULTISPECIES: HlyD family secretion protein [unclassified Herbaspirillum]|uniref:HlyD family secretion protein n=1 Tax=unclassified Herbaspirillum TaxID=2624150 RepID=UPI0015844C38|nr:MULTISPECIES: HlyD family secretion protein [unclassified Herbaspirillum]MCI1005094.1 HlyD family secretion protein [Herbaspirillum sp. C7C8]NUT61476.1 HlyD family secretion protein [Herbaspirillum sp. C9C3]